MKYFKIIEDIELALGQLEEANILMREAEARVQKIKADIAFMETEYDRMITAPRKRDVQ